MSEHILVTGAAGFLGSHICNYFGQRGHSIAAVDRISVPSEMTSLYPNLWKFFVMNLPDNSFTDLIKDFKPRLLIHCAGSASVPYSMQEPYDDFKQSVGVTAFILEALRKHIPSCHFIFLSSAAVYGNPQKLPISEDSPCQPISPYGYHKYISEILCEEYKSIYKIKSTILRIFSAYGERLHKQVIFDLCRKFADTTSDTVEIYGTGNETRDFIHAIDIAQSIYCIYQARATGTFNVASGSQIRIGEIVQLIRDCFNTAKNIFYTGSTRPGDPLYWQADISKLCSLGFQQHISIQKGIKNYIIWFKSVYGGAHDQ